MSILSRVLLFMQRGQMITVQIRPESLKIRGHAGYAPRGLDIVCAGITALTQTLIHSIEALTHDLKTTKKPVNPHKQG